MKRLDTQSLLSVPIWIFRGITQENAQSNVYFFEPAEINGMKVDGMKWIGNKYRVEINDKTYELVDNLVPHPLNFWL